MCVCVSMCRYLWLCLTIVSHFAEAFFDFFNCCCFACNFHYFNVCFHSFTVVRLALAASPKSSFQTIVYNKKNASHDHRARYSIRLRVLTIERRTSSSVCIRQSHRVNFCSISCISARKSTLSQVWTLRSACSTIFGVFFLYTLWNWNRRATKTSIAMVPCKRNKKRNDTFFSNTNH